MKRVWTDVVAAGTALGIRSALGGCVLTADLVDGVVRGLAAHVRTLHPARNLQAVGQIRGFGRQRTGFFTDGPDIRLSATRA